VIINNHRHVDQVKPHKPGRQAAGPSTGAIALRITFPARAGGTEVRPIHTRRDSKKSASASASSRARRAQPATSCRGADLAQQLGVSRNVLREALPAWKWPACCAAEGRQGPGLHPGSDTSRMNVVMRDMLSLGTISRCGSCPRRGSLLDLVVPARLRQRAANRFEALEANIGRTELGPARAGCSIGRMLARVLQVLAHRPQQGNRHDHDSVTEIHMRFVYAKWCRAASRCRGMAEKRRNSCRRCARGTSQPRHVDANPSGCRATQCWNRIGRHVASCRAGGNKPGMRR